MKEKCDYCGEVKDVVVTIYGTTHYNRFICKECIERVNQYHKELHGWEKTINEDGSLANQH